MQNINVNIVPDSYPQTIRYSQGDVGREFTINVTGFTIPTGATVKIQATKPSGFGFSVAGTVAGNAVSFTTTAVMTDEAGRFPAELKITKDSVVIGTANFIMWGEVNPHPEGTTDGQQGTIIPELTLLVERVEAAASSVLDMEVVANTLPAGSQATYSYDEDLNKATFGIPQGEAGAGAAGVVASAYSASATYKVGDYVIHNSNLYRCTIAITTAEAFTAAHWTQIVLADDVSDLKTDLEDITDNIVIHDFKSGYITTSGSTADINSPSSSTSFRYAVVECQEGDIFTINAFGGDSPRACAFIDSQGNVLMKAGRDANLINHIVVAPTDSAYMVINDKTTNNGTSFVGAVIKETIANDNRELEEIKGSFGSENIANPTFFVEGLWVLDNGREVARNDYFATGYIAVNEGDKIYCNHYIRSIGAYNVNGFPITGSFTEDITVGNYYTVPSGGVSVRITADMDGINDLMVSVGSLKAFKPYDVILNNAVSYVSNLMYFTSADKITSILSSTGWTVSDGVYTHQSGNGNALSFNTGVEVGKVYCLEFDTNITDAETVKVGLGTAYKIETYNGTSHITVFLKAIGGTTLYLEPVSQSFTGSISNIKLYEVSAFAKNGFTAKSMQINSVLSNNHSENYGYWNTFIGDNAPICVGSTRSIAIGNYAMNVLQGGHRNIAIGTYSMSQMIGGERNIAIGSDAMLELLGASNCVAIGTTALYSGQKNENCTALGDSAIGYNPSTSNLKGVTAVGAKAGAKCGASENTFVGAWAGYNVQTGSENVIVGYLAEGQSTGNRLIIIGNRSGYSNGINNAIVIGQRITATKSNQVIIGNADNDEFVLGNKKLIFNEDGTVSWEALT